MVRTLLIRKDDSYDELAKEKYGKPFERYVLWLNGVAYFPFALSSYHSVNELNGGNV